MDVFCSIWPTAGDYDCVRRRNAEPVEQEHWRPEIKTSAVRATGRNTNIQRSDPEAREDDSGI